MGSKLKKTGIQVLFFGLPRATTHTYQSVELLLSELTGVTRYGAFMNKPVFSNERTSERSESIDFLLSRRLLGLSVMELISPDDKTVNDNITVFRKFGNAFDDAGGSLINLIEQLTTLRYCAENFLRKDADFYIFARPDVMFSQPIRLDKLDSHSIYFPSWQSYGGYNDRFAATRSYDAAMRYAQRINDAYLFCDRFDTSLHSERLLAFSMKRHGLKVRKIPIQFRRVRNDGRVEEEVFFDDMWKTKFKSLACKLR